MRTVTAQREAKWGGHRGPDTQRRGLRLPGVAPGQSQDGGGVRPRGIRVGPQLAWQEGRRSRSGGPRQQMDTDVDPDPVQGGALGRTWQARAGLRSKAKSGPLEGHGPSPQPAGSRLCPSPSGHRTLAQGGQEAEAGHLQQGSVAGTLLCPIPGKALWAWTGAWGYTAGASLPEAEKTPARTVGAEASPGTALSRWTEGGPGCGPR